MTYSISSTLDLKNKVIYSYKSCIVFKEQFYLLL